MKGKSQIIFWWWLVINNERHELLNKRFGGDTKPETLSTHSYDHRWWRVVQSVKRMGFSLCFLFELLVKVYLLDFFLLSSIKLLLGILFSRLLAQLFVLDRVLVFISYFLNVRQFLMSWIKLQSCRIFQSLIFFSSAFYSFFDFFFLGLLLHLYLFFISHQFWYQSMIFLIFITIKQFKGLLKSLNSKTIHKS